MNILFLNQEEPVMGTVTVQDLHRVKIEGVLQNLSGFHLVTNDGQVYGKYETYTTLYKTVEDGYILSDDGSVYVEPDPEPEPEPYVPTLEEIQEAKVNEMNAAQQAVIAEGVDVVLTDGSTEHFTLTERDQTSLVGLQGQVAAGEQSIPWHTSDEEEHCKF